MSAAPPQMRRIPDEQFFDLRSWSADKAEDYGEKGINDSSYYFA